MTALSQKMLRDYRAKLLIILTILASLLAPAYAYAQTSKPPILPPSTESWEKTLADRQSDFEALRQQRTDIIREIDATRQKIWEIDSEIATLRSLRDEAAKTAVFATSFPFQPNTKMLQIEKEELQQKIQAREKALNDAATPEEKAKHELQLSETRFQLKRIEVQIENDDKFQKEMATSQKNAIAEQEAKNRNSLEEIQSKILMQKNLQVELATKNARLEDINYKTARLIDKNDQSMQFRILTSLVFALLVAAVIIGFFLIAQSDDRVKFAIFGNDSGIQFITLFSIVIAVILFGIIGVLEGKELAALLGGLSGYILGRGSTLAANRTAAAREEQQQPPHPAPAAG